MFVPRRNTSLDCNYTLFSVHCFSCVLVASNVAIIHFMKSIKLSIIIGFMINILARRFSFIEEDRFIKENDSDVSANNA